MNSKVVDPGIFKTSAKCPRMSAVKSLAWWYLTLHDMSARVGVRDILNEKKHGNAFGNCTFPHDVCGKRDVRRGMSAEFFVRFDFAHLFICSIWLAVFPVVVSPSLVPRVCPCHGTSAAIPLSAVRLEKFVSFVSPCQ